MSESVREVVSIRSYLDVILALERANAEEGDEAPFDVDFSLADWANVEIKYEGENFHSSLPPSAMHGLIGLQETLHRSVAELLRDAPDIRKLTESEKVSFELTFTVGEGSSSTEGKGKGILETLAKVIASMDSRHKLIALLVLVPSYFASEGVKHYIDEKSKTENRESLLQLSNSIMGHDERMLKAVAESVQQSKPAAEIREQSLHGIDSVVRRSGPASSVTLQGTRLNNEQIEEARRNPRQQRRSFQVNQRFKIISVNSQSPNGFSVRIRSEVDGKEYWASLYDSIASDRDRATIRRAEWRKSVILLTVTGNQAGDRVTDARIINAKEPPASQLRVKAEMRFV